MEAGRYVPSIPLGEMTPAQLLAVADQTDLENVRRFEIEVGQEAARRLVEDKRLSDETLHQATQALIWALEQNFYLDKSNAAVHNAAVRFSPATFRLAEVLGAMADELEWETDALGQHWGTLSEVLTHRGQYAEDPGR
jgi:hypothetical protein